MASKIIFGTAGIPHSSKRPDSVGGIGRIQELGLGAMELEFVRGVNMGEAAAGAVGKAQKESGIALSVHAPYYVNLAAKEKAKREASRKRILDSARIGALCGATIAVFHPGFYQGRKPDEVYKIIKAELEEMAGILRRAKNPVLLGLETTGKHSAFGSLEENLALSEEIEQVSVCIDFAHLFARANGAWKAKEDYAKVIETVESMNKKLLGRIHIHASGMNYTTAGERNHLNMQDLGNRFNYKFMLEALKDANASGTVICESPNLEGDAVLMKKYWEKL